MALTLTTENTVLGALAPKSAAANAAFTVATVVAGSLILALAAQIKVPMIPVPMQLSTLAVALVAGALGWRLGLATVVLYIVEGLGGLPFFSNGGGIGYIFSPTFGFIVGYLPLAFVVGLAADRGLGRNVVAMFGAALLADALCFLLGFVWLVAMSGAAKWIDQSNVLGSAFSVAIAPFILGDILKMAITALVLFGAGSLLRRRA